MCMRVCAYIFLSLSIYIYIYIYTHTHNFAHAETRQVLTQVMADVDFQVDMERWPGKQAGGGE